MRIGAALAAVALVSVTAGCGGPSKKDLDACQEVRSSMSTVDSFAKEVLAAPESQRPAMRDNFVAVQGAYFAVAGEKARVVSDAELKGALLDAARYGSQLSPANFNQDAATAYRIALTGVTNRCDAMAK